MEFFATAAIDANVQALQSVTVAGLDRYCSEIDRVLDVVDEDEGEIYCTWGQFRVLRQLINGGVRFTLPGCPNALSWTLTTGHPPDPQGIVIHLTINRADHDPDFVASIEDFVEAWRRGLETGETT